MQVPALAWGVARGLALGAAGVGLVVAAAAPGGSTGPLMASVAGGEPRVAVRWFFALTTIGTVTALVGRIAIAQVSTVRNLTLALLVLSAVGAAPEATLAVLAYGLAMYVGAGGVAVWTRYAAPE